LGVVALIVPWNFPLTIASWKVAPALAAGNTIVLKPAGLTPLTAVELGKIALEAGLPEGVLNVIVGSGRLVGERLVQHPDVAKVAFTGSTEVGEGAQGRRSPRRADGDGTAHLRRPEIEGFVVRGGRCACRHPGPRAGGGRLLVRPGRARAGREHRSRRARGDLRTGRGRDPV